MGSQFIANLKEFTHGDRRARDGFLGLDLAALDAFGNRYFTLARQERHYAHLAKVKPHRVVGLLESASGKIELEVFVAAVFVIRSDGRRLLNQAFIGIRHVDIRSVQLLQHVFDIVR